MALILLFKLVVALSVLIWYGVAVLRFVNDYFHSQFRKQLVEEYMHHMKNLDGVHNARTLANDYDPDERTSTVMARDGIILESHSYSIVAENDNRNERKMDTRESQAHHEAFSIQPDHHYYSILRSTQSGGQGRDQKPQSEFTKGEWILRTSSKEKSEPEDDFYVNDYPHTDEQDDDDHTPFRGYSCGEANAKYSTGGSLTSAADLSREGNAPSWNGEEEDYCMAEGNEEADHIHGESREYYGHDDIDDEHTKTFTESKALQRK